MNNKDLQNFSKCLNKVFLKIPMNVEKKLIRPLECFLKQIHFISSL